MKRKERIFNNDAFGALLREKRKEQGYKNVNDFSAAILDKTGLSINPETLARYERGERKPDIEQFLALAITLTDKRDAYSWAQGITQEVYLTCLDGKPYLFRLRNSLDSISQGLSILERMNEKSALRNSSVEAGGWRVQAFIERLDSIAEELERLDRYDTELEELGISQVKVQSLKDRALLLLPVFND